MLVDYQKEMFQTVQNKNIQTPDRSDVIERGFTIIELLVVMAIMGILMMVGINAFMSTRRSREVADVVANVRGLIKTAREMSLSVAGAGGDKWPVAYEVVIGSNSATLNIYYSAGEQHEDWNVASSFTKTPYSSINYGGVSSTTSGCDRVVFSSVNGNMFVYKSDKTNGSPCAITFTQGDKSRILTLNSVNKTFDIQ